MTHALLFVVVFISGACVLAVEILGTRVLGPFYGVSLFLWSALITVTLAALSLGYTLGGRWADRGPRYSRLAWILAAAGVWLIATPWMKHPVLNAVEPAGLRVAVLAASFVLFFVPLTLMGMVTPYAIRLKAQRLEEVGRTAGNIYAVSTVASVAAALLTGFILIPSVGVSRLLLIIGVVLLVGALTAALAGRQSRAAAVVILIALVGGGVVAWRAPADRPDPAEGLLTVRQSPYAEIRVVDWGDARMLLIDGGCHTSVERGTWKTYYPYVQVMDINKYMFREPGKMLLMGLGGGSIAKSYAESNWSVDVVEIDPTVVEVAHEYFGLTDDEASVTTMDGRQYLITHDAKYDLIVLDAFGSSSIPFHLVTQEAFGLVKEHLNPGGILAINIEADGWHDTLVRSLGKTLHEHFSQVLALPLAEPRNAFGNLVLIATNRDAVEFPEGMLGRPYDFLGEEYLHDVVVARNHAWDNRFEPDTEGVPVLTDDLNPVGLWAEKINRKARQILHGDYGWKALAY
jgi:predicted membrane-bound spermidine synthase